MKTINQIVDNAKVFLTMIIKTITFALLTVTPSVHLHGKLDSYFLTGCHGQGQGQVCE